MRTINFIGTLHHKNEEGANLMKDYFNIEFDGPSRDVVVHCSDTTPPIGVVDLYGPQIDFRIASQIKGKPVNFLSDWVCDMAKKINPECDAITLPFPVNTEKFKPLEKTNKPIVYYKRRESELLNDVISFIKPLFPEFVMFSYENRYEEGDYIKSCGEAPFCIWVGAHESQGFALQECLSTNTPILVINVNSMNDEISIDGHRYWDSFWQQFPATTAPYFDDRCGIIAKKENWKIQFDYLINNLSSYKPREYVLENLSPEVISNKWMKLIKNK